MSDALFFAIGAVVFVLWFVQAKRYKMDAVDWVVLVVGCAAIVLVALIVPAIW